MNNKKWTHLGLAAIVAAGMAFSGGCATWDKIWHKHEDKCIPICHLEKADLIEKTTKDWEWFKNYKPIPYQPTGDRYIDDLGTAVDKLSNEIYNEYIIAYLEGAEHTEAYNFFLDEVTQCSKQNKMPVAEARQLIWAEWVKEDLARPAEERRCQELCNAFNALESMNPKNQIPKLLTLVPEIQRLVQMNHGREIKRISAESKRNISQGIGKGAAAMNIGLRATNLLRATNYMLDHFKDVADADADFAEFEKEYKIKENTEQAK